MKTINIQKQKVNLKSCVLWVILVLVLTSSQIRAQQEPSYTQYMFNTQTINPAYAGTWNALGFMVLAREQWTGIDGAPSTQTLSFQNLHKNEKTGYGLNIINDKFGKKRDSQFMPIIHIWFE
jgi:type IX secretion system PorP/SprF family membrane protein